MRLGLGCLNWVSRVCLFVGELGRPLDMSHAVRALDELKSLTFISHSLGRWLVTLADVDPNVRTASGGTALFYACHEG